MAGVLSIERSRRRGKTKLKIIDLTMSPTQQFNGGQATSSYPSPLKINKDSHFIKKPPTSPPPTPSSAATKPPHRQPVIIYTHSPKIIHTHPRDFMALVQKLTGQSPSDSSESIPATPKQEPPPPPPVAEDQPNKNHRRRVAAAAASDDTTDSSSSVVTDENCTSTRVRNVQIKSCFPPPPPPPAFYDHHPPPINPCFSNVMNIPFFPSPNSGDHFYSSPTLAHQPFFGSYNDSSLLLMNNNINMRSSISSSSSSSSSTFDGMA